MTDKIRLMIGCMTLLIAMAWGFVSDSYIPTGLMSIISTIWFASVENER
jgi:hypothetical protein